MLQKPESNQFIYFFIIIIFVVMVSVKASLTYPLLVLNGQALIRPLGTRWDMKPDAFLHGLQA